ncbi:hypothetical protein DAPPUDRAFT_327376 [Daphnia pulex]|uniref:Ion transport domain-containing protein n=1 Tax=Daphnia pulex TaxID=6669 RepID=E9HAK3_DAPPU|nr:hypothetical protein DAPPUDRAFT_327376 [Daphnia pulex]|eukprot:EFX71249.1 hypothetical protein DAPPUDRAFT_327376 [Daphnia pulex]
MSSRRSVSRENVRQRSFPSLSSISETESPSFDFTESFEVLDEGETISPTVWCVWPQQMLMVAIDEKLFTKSPLNVRLCKPRLNVSLGESDWKEIPPDCYDIGVLFAALNGAVLCLNLLIRYKATVDVLDRNKEATPLFCAAASGRIELVEALLSCATRLVEAGANVNNLQVLCESPIHVSAFQGDVDCLKLLLENKADAKASTTEIDKPEAVGRTPLHLAALSQSVESVKVLLDYGARHDICDGMKETPLHSAVVKCRRSIDVVRLLISRGANVNVKNQFSQTPLHLAAINEHSKLASFLILSGADLSAKNRAKNTALALVARRVPDALSTISRKLDSAIEIAGGLDPTDADCELRLDLQVLVPSGNQQKEGEMAMLTSMIAADQHHLLLHPVIGAFLHLKWTKIRTTFLASLMFQFCYVLFLTLNIYTTYVSSKNEKAENGTTNLTNHNNSTGTIVHNSALIDSQTQKSYSLDYFWLPTIFFGSMTGCKELFQLYCNPHEYVTDVENYAHLFSVVGMVLVIPRNKDGYVSDWQTHVAAVVIIVAWINLMLHIGRFPAFGLYIQMFTTVAWNMSKLLVTYFCLIVGFSLGFAVLFPKSKFFGEIPIALLTAIVMMTGEMDFNALFYDENGTEKIRFPGTTHLVFLFFVLLIVIVLMNLLVGLAVSDIQGLLNSAGLNRLIRTTKQIARMEIFIFFPWPIRLPQLWSKIPKRECLQRKVLVVSPKAKRTYNFKPNDPRDGRFPQNTKEGLLAIAVERMASKKKGPYQYNALSVQTNGEFITDVFHRVDELFTNYMSEIVTMNEKINEKLALLEDANRFRLPLIPARKIVEEFSHCDTAV